MKEQTPFDKLAKPAQRALANAGIKKVEQLADITEAELMQLHGIGKNAVLTLKALMTDRNVTFK